MLPKNDPPPCLDDTASAAADAAPVIPVLVMRSRMPRKVYASELAYHAVINHPPEPNPTASASHETALFASSGGDKDVYAMDFIGGGQNRVREASRKNVVVEEASAIGLRLTVNPALRDSPNASSISTSSTKLQGSASATASAAYSFAPLEQAETGSDRQQGSAVCRGATMQVSKAVGSSQ
jgi:hypothetical protein